MHASGGSLALQPKGDTGVSVDQKKRNDVLQNSFIKERKRIISKRVRVLS